MNVSAARNIQSNPTIDTFDSAALSLMNLIKKFNLSFLPIIWAVRSWFGRMISESNGGL